MENPLRYERVVTDIFNVVFLTVFAVVSFTVFLFVVWKRI